MEFLADYEFDLSQRKGASNANANGLSRIHPCAELDGETCQQCQKRVTGRHDLKVIQTRSRSREETLKSSGGGPRPLPLKQVSLVVNPEIRIALIACGAVAPALLTAISLVNGNS